MKKILTFLLALGVMACFTACDGNKPVSSGDKEQSGEQQNQSEGTILKIEGNPTTGYSWHPSNYDATIIRIEELENEEIPNENQTSGESGEHIVGAPSEFKFRIVGLKEGVTNLTFDYYRPWEGAETSIDTVEYVVTVDELLNVIASEKVPDIPSEDEYTASEEMQTLIDDLVAKSKVEFSMAATSKILLPNAPTFVGLSEELFTQNVVDSVVYEPMISPATSSLCIVKLSDTADVATLKQTVLDNCNPAKWVCTGAKKCLVIESGRYIMLVMSTPEDCEAFQKAFTEHFGADKVGSPLMKDGVSEEVDELPPEMY